MAQGILASLNAIAVAAAGPANGYYTNRSPEPTPKPTPVPEGTHSPAVIVLLSDGENNENPDPIAAAQAAADQGVRIHTVGMGSPAGTTLDVNGFRVHTQLNEDMLKQIAQVSGGVYRDAQNQQDLSTIYNNLDTQLVIRPEMIEVTSIVAGASILVLLIGAAFSFLWLGRLP